MAVPHTSLRHVQVLMAGLGRIGICNKDSKTKARIRSGGTSRYNLRARSCPGVPVAKRQVSHSLLALVVSVSLMALPGFSSNPHRSRTEGITSTISEARAGLRFSGVSSSIAPSAGAWDLSKKAAANLPMAFELNQGQVDNSFRYFARGAGYSVSLSGLGAEIDLQGTDPRSSSRLQSLSSAETGSTGRSRIRPSATSPSSNIRSAPSDCRHEDSARLSMKVVGGSRAARVAGVNQLPGKVNYFAGKDPTKWRTNVPTYAAVEYKEIYPGIDMVFYGSQRRLEYDFIVAPGADPRAIRFRFDAADGIRIDRSGDLILQTRFGELRQQKPIVYQESGGVRREVAGRYSLRGGRDVAFVIGPYDRNKRLVIDPVLSFSTYLSALGGSVVRGVAIDAEGGIYVTGVTYVNLLGGNPLCSAYAFVTKLNAAATAVVYSTFIGGGDQCNGGNAIAVDAGGSAYITGSTNSKEFPTTPSAFQTSFGGLISAFVTKLSQSGDSLVYSSYLGGPTLQGFASVAGQGKNVGLAIAVDHFGNAYLTGNTDASDFPTVKAIQPRNPGGFCVEGDFAFSCPQEAFVAKVNSPGTALIYSTYLGGAGVDSGAAIAVDSTGSVYVTGSTSSGTFPTVNPVQTRLNGPSDAFITKMSPEGDAILYSTYLGGSGSDFARGVAVDSSGSAYLTGGTFSIDFPATPGALQPSSADGSLFKSTDGGGSWKPIGKGLLQTNLSTDSVVYDSVNPSTMFLGTKAGVFKSTDGGLSWKATTLNYVDELAISSTSPATLYATTLVVPALGTRIIRSTDGGETWKSVPNSLDVEYISALAVDPLDPLTVYASLQKFAPVSKSTDGGESWKQIGDALPPSHAIVFDPVEPATIYAVSGSNVLKSTDGGRRWRQSSNGLMSTVFAIAVDPRSHHTIYAATLSGVFKSTNGGRRWERTNLSQIVGTVAVDSNGSGTVYAGSYGSSLPGASFDKNDRVFKSIDGGQSWRVSGEGLPPGPINTLVIDPRNPAILHAGTAGGGPDAFIAKLDAGGTALAYATYLGGPGSDTANAIAVDILGNALVVGQTESRLFPNRNAFQFDPGANERAFEGDAFVMKLNAQGNAIIYSTYLGGSFADQGLGIALESGGRAIVVGSTTSSDFPTRNPIQGSRGNFSQGFIVSLADFESSAQPPIVAAVTPAIGSTTGGDTITITGANFASGVSVTISGVPANLVQRVDSASIRVTTGAGVPGRGKIRVTNPDGQNDTLIEGFRYVSPPVVSTVEIKSKKLQVMGANFDLGSTIIVDGADMETENDPDSPASTLIARKANKKIDRGQTVVIRVRNPDGILSRAVTYKRPE